MAKDMETAVDNALMAGADVNDIANLSKGQVQVAQVETLDALDGGMNLTLDDAMPIGHDGVKVFNKASATNAAAQAAVLSSNPEAVESNYRIVSAEIEDAGLQSEAYNNIMSMIKDKTFEANRSAFVDFLADPSVSDGEKKLAAEAMLDREAEAYSPQNIIATASLVEEDGPNEPIEKENGRIALADVMYEVQQRKGEMQNLLNREVAKSDISTKTATLDFLQYMMPFMESTFAGKIKADLEEDDSAFLDAFTLLGSAKSEIRDAIKNAPEEDKLVIAQKVVELVNNHSSIVMKDQNDFARVDLLRTFLEDGYYEDVDVWLDNVIGVLDLTVLGGPVGRVARAGRRFFGAKDLASNVARDAARSGVQPSSVSQVYKDTNVSKARAAHEQAAMSGTDEAAQALYGTTKEEAIANDLMPEVGKADGSVRNKVGNPDLNIVEMADKAGHIHYTDLEKTQLRKDVENKLVQANGMTPRKEMFSVTPTASGTKVRAVYGPLQGGVSNARDAMDMALWALRDSGATEDTVKLLRREGDEYVPTTLEELDALKVIKEVDPKAPLPKEQPDYLVALDYEYEFNPMDVTKWSEFDVNYNLFNRIGSNSNLKGVATVASRLQRYALDPHSMFDTHLTLGANSAIDKAAGLEQALLEVGDKFGKGFLELDKGRQNVLEDIIKEANYKGKEPTYTELVAQGVTPKEQKVLQDWRNYWDSVYYLENRDAVTSLRNGGYKQFVDKDNDTLLFARPIQKGNLKSSEVYNSATGQVETLSRGQIDELYSKQGAVAQLRNPINVDGVEVGLVKVENTSKSNYLRDIGKDSQALSRRPGYYTVHYTDPKFIVKKVKDDKGNVLFTRAVATASGNKTADLMVRRLKDTDGGEYFVRDDMKGSAQSSGDRWDVAMNSGRSVQRARGQRLGDHESGSMDASQAPIMGPVDSMILSARSTSHRVSVRNLIETSKSRMMNQYADYLPKDEYGRAMWPDSIEKVMYRGENAQRNKDLADARATFEYIDYLENGYVNHIDATYKALLKGLADITGNIGSAKLDKAMQWMSDTRGPSAMGKNLAFNMYLATNPLRQLVVQGHQAVQLLAYNPKWALSNRAGGELLYLVGRQMGKSDFDSKFLDKLGMTAKEADEMYKQFKLSGLAASIDKQNLIRSGLHSLADETVKRDVKPLSMLRKVGFDAGENFNMMTSWLAHRDKAVRDGLDMGDATVADKVGALARNYTYNMNAAGDMPYNTDSLALVFQFFQVPHKALTQMTTNRVLTKGQKLRLGAFNATMYTLPPAAIYSLVESLGMELPENEIARDLVVQGVEGVFLNALLNQTLGEGSTDFSGLSPVDMYGTYEFIHSLFTTDAGKILASTPSGQLLFGGNPRLTNFAKSAARMFNLGDYEETPTEFGMVAQDFLKLSSGFSNAFKAQHALATKETLSRLDMSVTERESYMMLFGFGTQGEAAARWNSQKTYAKSKELKEDVRKWYSEYKRQLSRADITPQEGQYAVRMFNEFWRSFDEETDYAARQELNKMIRRDVLDKDATFYNNVMRVSGYSTNAEIKMMFETLPKGDAVTEQQLMQLYDKMIELGGEQ